MIRRSRSDSRKGAKGAKDINLKLEIRNSKQIQNDQKAQNLKQTRFGFRFSDFGSECFGLFRISIFGFRIFIR